MTMNTYGIPMMAGLLVSIISAVIIKMTLGQMWKWNEKAILDIPHPTRNREQIQSDIRRVLWIGPCLLIKEKLGCEGSEVFKSRLLAPPEFSALSDGEFQSQQAQLFQQLVENYVICEDGFHLHCLENGLHFDALDKKNQILYRGLSTRYGILWPQFEVSMNERASRAQDNYQKYLEAPEVDEKARQGLEKARQDIDQRTKTQTNYFDQLENGSRDFTSVCKDSSRYNHF